MTAPVAFLFPGQNSRYPAMLEKLLAGQRDNEEVMERASDTLGRDLKTHFRAENRDIFRHNGDVQIAVFLANHMHWQILDRAGVRAEFSAGLSLGEYNHLVHIGALEFEDALRVLAVRGEAYESAPRGMMAAVYPLSPEEVQTLVRKAECEGKLGIAMLNTPQQCVLSGDRMAVELVLQQVEEDLCGQYAVIDDRLPMHSSLFRGVGEKLRPALNGVIWRSPFRPYLPNVKGDFLFHPSAGDFVDALASHPWKPVRWKESMENLAAAAPGVVVVETGPKSVLTGFFSKRWLNPRRYSTDSIENFGAHLEVIVKELASGIPRTASVN
jgi:[acyl-carrier-protein] S-malonyltransferase